MKCPKDCNTPKVLELHNHECPVLFHKVIVPAAMGDDETTPPRPGMYRNVLLVYEANSHVWMYSSDGIPTYISDGSRGVEDYEELLNKPLINGHELIGDSSLEDIGVTDAIDDALADYTPTADLADVALSGDYDDLSNKPTIPAAQVNSDWNASSGVAEILNKPTLATVATSGSYNDLSNKPTIPTVNNATLTIQKNGTNVQTFTANQSTNATANITVPTKTSELTNDSSFVTSSGTVAKADQLTTARTIALSGGAIGTATSFNGTSNISIPVTKMYETYLDWGNQKLSGRVSPVDAGMSEEFSANRLAYMDASKITVEYSRDGGSTWTDYGLTAAQKTGFVTTSQAIYTGGTSSNAAGNYQVRVNLNPTNPYMSTRKLFIYVSTNGVSNAQVLIEKKAMGGSAYETVTTATISGWSGWNSIPITITFGGTTSWSNSDLRLTFSYNGKSESYPNAQLQISKIRLYGETAWSAPSNLATNGHIYSYDTSQNATFPANVNITGSLGHDSYTYTLPNKNGTVAMTSDIPSVPTVNNGQLTIQKNGSNVATFTANQSGNATANITVPTATSDLTNDGSDGTSTYVEADDLATVATSGSYNDLSNKPTIPTVNDATLTIQRNSTTVGTFTANASQGATVDIAVPTKTSNLTNDGSDGTAAYLETDETAYRTTSIPYGHCDSTSTATVFTATVPGITELRDGVVMWLKNGVVTSASGFTININNLGAKPVYSNLSAATRDTTIWNVNYTMMFVYDSTRASGGCWILYRGYNSDTNTIAYQVRTNSQSLPMTSVVYRYRLLFTSADNNHYVPATNSTSTNATSSRTVCQDKINPFGRIFYYSSTSSIAANARPGATALWEQYAIALGYSFNRTGEALTLTSWKPVYLKCAPQTDGSAIMDSTTPIVQDLPTTEDGKIYIFLGVAYSATNIELQLDHPVYEYKGGMIRPYTNAAQGVTSFNGSTGAITYTAPVESVNGATGAITGLQTTSNLVTSISSASTDSQYPSAKLVYDTIGDVETILSTLNNGGGAQ